MTDRIISIYGSLEDVPSDFTGIAKVENANYNILIKAQNINGTITRQSDGSSTTIANRPSAILLGKGSWQTDNKIYLSNGADYSVIPDSYNVPTIAIIGDSIGAYNSSSNTTEKNYNQSGAISCAMSLAGWPFEFQPSDNYAVPGATLETTISVQLPLILAANVTRKYNRCFISVMTNNTATLLPELKTLAMSIFSQLREVGIMPVHCGILPKGNDASLTNAKMRYAAMNEWMYQLSLTGFIEFIDITSAYADITTGFGNALVAMMPDYVHPNNLGGYRGGRIIADYYASKGFSPILKFATQQSDTYEILHNPYGVAFDAPNPLLIGGTTAPTGMTTSGGTWSKVNRTLPNGQVRSDPTVAVLSPSTTHSLYDDLLSAGGWGATDIQPGDIIEARAKVVIVGGAGITQCYIACAENNGQAGATVVANGNNPTLTDTSGIPDGDHTFYLKSPRITVRPYWGSGTALIYASVFCKTNASGAGAFTVQALEVRKVG